MENAGSLGNWVAYAVLWAFILACALLVLRAAMFFIAIVAIGVSEKQGWMPAEVRRWALRRARHQGDGSAG